MRPESAKLSSASPDSIGERVGRYEILGRLDDEAGRVYLAHDPKLVRRVAIELLDGSLGPEARALAKLSHPNLVSVYDVGAAGDGKTFVAMELVDGTPLSRYLVTRELSWRDVVELFVQAGRGLAAAHAEGFVHGAFSADEVLVSRSSRVVVGGFIRPMASAADPAEADPAEADPADLLADQLAFCAALDRSLADRSGARRPRRLAAAVARGLAGGPRDRHPSMDALLGELETIVRASRRRPVVAAAIAAAGVAAAAVGFAVGGAREPCPAADDRLAQAWDPERRRAARESLSSADRPYAATLADRIVAAFDAYGERWIAQRQATCRATHVHQEQSPALLDARIACFDRRLDELGALADIMATADGALLDRGLGAVARLSDPRMCTRLDPSSEPALAVPETPEAEQAAEMASRARALDLAGRWEQADELALRGLDLARAADSPALVGRLGTLSGVLASKLDRYDEAEATLEEAATAAAEVGDTRRVAEAWIGLTQVVGVKQGRLEVGLTWGAAAAREVGLLADAARLQSRLHSTLGQIHARAGDIPAATASYDAAVEVAETIGDRSPIEHAARLVHAGAFHRAIDAPDRAAELLERALSIYRREFTPEHPAVAQAKRELAIVKYMMGDHEGARALHLEARAAFEAALGPAHSQLAETEIRLAETLLALGEIGEAGRRAESSIEISTANGEDRSTARALAHLGEIRRREGRLGEALELHGRALALLESAYGSEHLIVGRQLTRLGIVYRRLDRLDEAEDAFARSLENLEATEGPEAPSVAHALFNLAGVLVARGRCDDAEPMLDRVTEIFANVYGAESAEVSSPLVTLGRCALKRRRPGDAVAAFERALDLRQRGAMDPMGVAEVHHRLAEALWTANRRREAVASARRALELLGDAEAVEPMRAEVRRWLREHPH